MMPVLSTIIISYSKIASMVRHKTTNEALQSLFGHGRQSKVAGFDPSQLSDSRKTNMSKKEKQSQRQLSLLVIRHGYVLPLQNSKQVLFLNCKL